MGVPAVERVFIGLGGNLGDARATLLAALEALAADADIELVARSSFWCSAPLDAAGPDYVNAVAELRTTLEPPLLLARLHALEQSRGRERPFTNAPRTLDLDLLLFGDRQSHDPRCLLPHPRLHRRAFVLQPLLELASGLSHPVLQQPLASCLAACADQVLRRLP